MQIEESVERGCTSLRVDPFHDPGIEAGARFNFLRQSQKLQEPGLAPHALDFSGAVSAGGQMRAKRRQIRLLPRASKVFLQALLD